MEFTQWEPIYEQILQDFGYSRKEDEYSAKILSELLEKKDPIDLNPNKVGVEDGIEKLQPIIMDREVLVCGNAPCLQEDINKKYRIGYVVIAADGATTTLLHNNIIPDIIVTDLDGVIEDLIYANHLGALMVVHAHGDNIKAIKEIVPKLKNIIGTTQSRPLKKVYNFGGFSDGDRCVFLAKYFKAKSITIIGFDFEDPKVNPIKKKKLKWAKQLINMIDL
ncbi:MAG: 6-hydroxymethylpterin diphosphokinase MptE-like protein [Methanosarcinales archaeon]